ncbi:MAG: hypothetical protein ACKOUM_07825, partial [Sphingopyxis sp.]
MAGMADRGMGGIPIIFITIWADPGGAAHLQYSVTIVTAQAAKPRPCLHHNGCKRGERCHAWIRSLACGKRNRQGKNMITAAAPIHYEQQYL